MNRQLVLKTRPSGVPTGANFELVERELAPLREHEVLVRNQYLSVDPYMRGRMSAAKSYAEPQALGAVMIGATVGTVLESRSERFSPGDAVLGMGGWQEHSVFDARESGPAGLARVDTRRVPLSAYLGVVGMPGVTAWYGLERVLEVREGQTVLVSAAAGAVGSVVGQLAKLRGCRAVGIAGGEAKCRHVVEDLRFDACVDYTRARDTRALAEAIEAVTPGGVSALFENVGGRLLDAALTQMNPFGRVALCGMIAGYNGDAIPLMNPSRILTARLRVEGFIVTEHRECWPPALEELATRVASGQLVYRETVTKGLERAPEALSGLFAGRNLGKQLVDLS